MAQLVINPRLLFEAQPERTGHFGCLSCKFASGPCRQPLIDLQREAHTGPFPSPAGTFELVDWQAANHFHREPFPVPDMPARVHVRRVSCWPPGTCTSFLVQPEVIPLLLP